MYEELTPEEFLLDEGEEEDTVDNRPTGEGEDEDTDDTVKPVAEPLDEEEL